MRRPAKTTKYLYPHRGETPTGRTINQALTDARTRLVEIRIAEMERELATLRETRVEQRQEATPRRTACPRPRNTDPRQVYIAALKARHPGLTGRAIAIALDNTNRKELAPRKEWIAATGLEDWQDLWDAKDKAHMGTRGAVRKYVYSVPAFRAAKQKTPK
jgi:hypothetical protein